MSDIMDAARLPAGRVTARSWRRVAIAPRDYPDWLAFHCAILSRMYLSWSAGVLSAARGGVVKRSAGESGSADTSSAWTCSRWDGTPAAGFVPVETGTVTS